MRDYAELISDLRRHHCDAKEDDTQEVCEECAYDVIVSDKSKFNGITDVCTCGLMHRAADAIEELLAAVPKWISVEERLPEDGDIVLVYWYNVHCCERDNFSVMRFRKGRTAEELKQADFFRSCDQWGNNKKPYDWSDTHGPLSLFGQDVTHWMPLPKAPKEVI